MALVGATGHGMWHRRQLTRLAAEGRLRQAGLCDVRPIPPAPDAPVPADLPTFTDYRAMLRATHPDVVIVCTPPHTHLPIAAAALRSGADVLLEKPPVLSMAEHRELEKVLAETGRVCQVGFQALGSAALRELTDAVAAGLLGDVTGIAAVASWQRDDAYYARSPWAGRRSVDGRPSVDGALANPLAHALMQSLAVAAVAAGGPVLPDLIELERYRTRPIEVDDTACLRLRTDGGLPIVAALTLCGEEHIAGEIIVSGTRGTAVLEYPTDRLLLPPGTPSRPGVREPSGGSSSAGVPAAPVGPSGFPAESAGVPAASVGRSGFSAESDGVPAASVGRSGFSAESAGVPAASVGPSGFPADVPPAPVPDRRLPSPEQGWRAVPGRVGLLENLLDHRADPSGVPLIVPLSRTAPFTALLEVIASAPEPVDVDRAYVREHRTGPDQGSRVNTITGVNAALRESARRLALLSELGVPWAAEPYRTG